MEVFGYISAIFIGILLGLIGSGGSILTVPVLVYLFDVEPVLATSYSLFIVGTTSILGSISYFQKGLVNLQTTLVFGVPSILSVYLTRTYLLPAIPEQIINWGNFELSKNVLLMILFAILMLFSATSMLKKPKTIETQISSHLNYNYPLILLEGTLVGILTGLVGAGGGFLIIPALVLFSNLPIKQAIGTSLVIIASKSLIGFAGEIPSISVNWLFLVSLTGLASLGILIGLLVSKRIQADKLKPFFGWFLLGMGFYILMKEIIGIS